MKSARLIVAAALVLLASQCQAAITYRMQPRDAVDDGWAFGGGYISTDGTLGEITPDNFLAWSFNVTSPAGQYTVNSEHGSAFSIAGSSVIANGSQIEPRGDTLAMFATHNELKIPPVDVGGGWQSSFDLFFYGEQSDAGGLTGPGLIVSGSSSILTGTRIGGVIFDDAIQIPDPLLIAPQAGRSTFAITGVEYVFASAVPEPSVLLAYCLSAMVLLSRRRFAL